MDIIESQIISKEWDQLRLHRVGAKIFENIKSKNQCYKNLCEGNFFVEGIAVPASYILKEGNIVQLKGTITCNKTDKQLEELKKNVEICYEDDEILVVWKKAGISLDPSSMSTAGEDDEIILNSKEDESTCTYKDTARDKNQQSKLEPFFWVQKSSNGFVLLRKKQYRIDIKKLERNYRLICQGKPNVKTLEGKNLYAKENFEISKIKSSDSYIIKIDGEIVSGDSVDTNNVDTIRFKIISTTKTSYNDFDNCLTTLDAYPLFLSESSMENHIKLYLMALNNIFVVGNNRYTKPLQRSKTNGTFLMLNKLSFDYDSKRMTFEKEESSKFEAMRLREQNAWLKKKNELEIEMSEIGVNYTDLKSDESVAHLSGKKKFWKHIFDVTEDVLIPKKCSEAIVEAFVKYMPSCTENLYHGKILDLGTGSGNLLLSCLDEYYNFVSRQIECDTENVSINIEAIGVDLSENALTVARKNILNFQFNEDDIKVSAVQGDFENLDESSIYNKEFDFVLCNPPYLPVIKEDGEEFEKQARKRKRQQEVLLQEPKLAILSKSEDGLSCYRAIATSISKPYKNSDSFILSKNGLLFIEVGQGLKDSVDSIFSTLELHSSFGLLELIDVIKDAFLMDRCLVYRRIENKIL